MESYAYKTYELDEELDLYINIDGVPKLLDENGSKVKEVIRQNQLQLPESEEDIVKQIERDFLEDLYLENETEEIRYNRIKRYQKLVTQLKQKYNYQCQICGYNFLMDNGKCYCEAHHIKMLSKDGSQNPDNVLILCANHHRMFHYASNTCTIGELVQGKRIVQIGKEKFMVKY